MTFKINGVDMLPYITAKGIKREEFDLEAPNAGRTTLDGEMHRAVISKKLKYTVTFKPLTEAEAQIVTNAISPQFVTAEISDMRRGDITITMYSNNIPATVAQILPDGSAMWEGIVAPFVER